MAPGSQVPAEHDCATNGDAAASHGAHWLVPALVSLISATLACGAAYLYLAAPGPWFGGAPTLRYNGAQMTALRGSGQVDGTRFVVTATDSANVAMVSVNVSALPASDYRRVRWVLKEPQGDVVLAMVWHTDRLPGKVNSASLQSSAEGVQTLLTIGEPYWSGRIGTMALAVRGTLRQPLIIESVTFDALGAPEVVADRWRDWVAFLPWNGLSINAAIGGPLEQSLWLTSAGAIVALCALALCMGWRRRHAMEAHPQFPLTVVAIIVAVWITLDARWLWIRLNQAQATAATFADKSPHEKHLADLDGNVYAFAERVRAKLPTAPARIYVTSDDHYFRARLAYHLFPHNSYVDHGPRGALPPPMYCKPGEYVVVFLRHGVAFDPITQTLSWDGQSPRRVELLHAEDGNALFKLL
jgi:hypothetical protein